MLASAVAACSDAEAPIPVARVQIEPSSAERVMGNPVQLRATTVDDKGAVLADRPVDWFSSGTSIADVDVNGLVSTHTPGVAVITASSEGKVGAATITVLIVPVASVQVTPAAAAMLPADQVQLQAATFDSVGGTLTGRVVTWSSSNEAVARVNSGGLVTAQAPGIATISGSSESKVGTAAITVRDPCDPTAGRPVTIGSTTNGLLAAADCFDDGWYFDFYTLDLSASAAIRIDLTSLAFDAFVFLLRGSQMVAYDDDSGGNGNARIIRTLAPGAYSIGVTSWYSGGTGSYQLRISAASAADALGTESGGVSAAAKPGVPPVRLPRVR